MAIKLLLGFTALLGSLGAAAQVYKWTDDMGHIHYSDRAIPGAHEMGFVGARTEPVSPRRPAAPLTQGYENLEILVPSDGTILDQADGNLQLSLLLQPGLQPEHTIRIVLNGQEQPLSVRATQIVLTDLPPGTHSISARVYDTYGEVVITSTPVTVHLRALQAASAIWHRRR